MEDIYLIWIHVFGKIKLKKVIKG